MFDRNSESTYVCSPTIKKRFIPTFLYFGPSFWLGACFGVSATASSISVTFVLGWILRQASEIM